MKRCALLILSLAMLTVLLGSCSTDSCPQNRATLPLAGFYNSEGKKIGLDSLLIYGIGGEVDSAIAAVPGTKISEVYLPMQPGSPHTIWVISYKEKNLDFKALNDTLTLRYTSEPYFASKDCGVVMYYHLTSLSHTCHLVDSVAVTDSLFNNYDFERMKIFFHTAESSEEPSDEIPSASSIRKSLRP